VNVFAHVAVAARAAGDPTERFLLGAALSDLATFGGFRLLGSSPDAEVRAGMALHHRTDDAFHGHPWFRERNRATTSALEASGLPRGAARACAHVGIELLLDGSLHPSDLDRTRFARALGVAGSLGGELGPLVVGERREAWLSHLAQLSDVDGLPPHDQPLAVARRLHRICARRPRLAFEARHVEPLTEVLALVAPGIAATGPRLVEDLAAALAPPGSP
jgi:hypothetical protein